MTSPGAKSSDRFLFPALKSHVSDQFLAVNHTFVSADRPTTRTYLSALLTRCSTCCANTSYFAAISRIVRRASASTIASALARSSWARVRHWVMSNTSSSGLACLLIDPIFPRHHAPTDSSPLGTFFSQIFYTLVAAVKIGARFWRQCFDFSHGTFSPVRTSILLQLIGEAAQPARASSCAGETPFLACGGLAATHYQPWHAMTIFGPMPRYRH